MAGGSSGRALLGLLRRTSEKPQTRITAPRGWPVSRPHPPDSPTVAPEVVVENNHRSYSATRVRLGTIKPEGGISRASQDDFPPPCPENTCVAPALTFVAYAFPS